jgi:hypothetical protein
MNLETIKKKSMGVGTWIKDKWDTMSGEKTLRTTQEYLDAAVGRLENLEKGYDFLRQNAVVRDDFESLRKKFLLLTRITLAALVLAVLSSGGTLYLFLHLNAR